MLQIKIFDTDQAIYQKLQNSRFVLKHKFLLLTRSKTDLGIFFYKKVVAQNITCTLSLLVKCLVV